MSDEIGKISLVADTSSLERATNELDKFAASGNKAATAADSLNDSNAQTSAKVKDVNAAFAAGAAVREQTRRSYEGTTKELQGLQRELVAIRGRVDPVGVAFDNLAAMSDKLREGLRQGLIDPADYAASVKGIDNLTNSLERSVYETSAAGKAAKEAAQAEKVATVAKESFISKLQEQTSLYKATASESAAYRAELLGISKEAAPLISLLQQQEEATRKDAEQKRIAAIAAKGLKDSIKQLEAEERAALKATKEQERADRSALAAKESFISRLREQAETQGKTNSELLEYKAAQLGATKEAAPFIASLKQQEDAWKKGTISAGQYRQAMRQLPAQITDVVTSLASGMPVYMVAIQQGGQIKDSFGGIGNAAKALISQLTPMRLLVSGITVSAVAMGIAYYQGAKESQEFNKQLILTGNYAGVTTGRLNDMAKTISKSGGTQGAAAAALAKVVGTGAFGANQLESVTRSALAMEKATGQSVDATIENFKRLKEDPLRAAQDLDKQLHFLTATQLESITKLSETGDVTAAARVAMDAYADSMQQRAADVTDSLGYLETGWNSIKSIASSAWDAMLGVGREDTIEDKIERLQKASKARALGMADVNVGVDTNSELAKLNDEKFQKDLKAAQRKGEQAEEERQKRELLANQRWNREYESDLEKHQRKLLEIKNDYASKEVKDNAIARENKRFAESQARKTKKPKAEKAFTDDAATKELAASQQRLAVLRGQSSITDKMTQQESRLLEFNQQISDLKNKSILTADQKSLLSRESEIRASLQLEANIAKENVQRDKAVKAMKTMSDYAKEIAERNRLATESFGLTTKQTERAAQESQLGKTFRKSTEGITDPAQLEKITAEYVKARDKLHEGFRDEDARESDWISGLNLGINQFAENSLNVFQATAQIGQTTMQSLSDMATDLASTGKANIKEFGTSILKMILQVINQLLVAYAIQSALGWMSGGASFSSTGLNDGTKGIPMPPRFDAGGYTGDGGKYEPKGIVHGGEFVFTKESTSRIGTDNLYALMRGYANGGLVGGASTGRAPMLGLQGGGSASGPIIQTSVVVNSEGGQQQQGGNSDAIGKAYQQVIDTSVRDGISKALRPGGLIWMAQNKR
ncbi:phage tail tape measure protein [Hafnia alvei]|uniref:phage tail tape measure protein n=1 Tax=Hafnia alvei TaxID=569 RepID=UPI002DB60A5D|nr:phage tail tape measure protein [Hafnia alvei]MEB7890970.1 phage tail tape measure protein [Hafnia alvei]